MRKNILFAFIFCGLAAESCFATGYSQCIKDEMKQRLSAMSCDFSKLVGARTLALNKCGPVMLEDLLKSPDLKPGSDEFKSSIDNRKRSANGDIDELAQAEAKKCGLNIKIEGDSITKSNPSSGSK